MERSSVKLLLTIAVLLSFFLPLFNWNSYEMNGMNYLVSSHVPSYKYVLALIPVSCIILFLDSFFEENRLCNRSKMVWIPLLTLLFIFVIRMIRPDDASSGKSAFSTTVVGFWITLFFSLMLVWVEKKKTAYAK